MKDLIAAAVLVLTLSPLTASAAGLMCTATSGLDLRPALALFVVLGVVTLVSAIRSDAARKAPAQA